MPRYDYRCTACDEVFPIERPLGYLDDELCPVCGEVAKRVFQVFEKQPRLGGGACSSEGGEDRETESCACGG